MTRSRQEWFDRLAEEERRLGLRDGFKMVFSPWRLLGRAEVAFLSLNPGPPPDGADLRTVTDERGNSYEVERWTTRSAITPQFLRLAERLGRLPGEILCGVASPFRSDRWTGLTLAQRQAGLALGREFWAAALDRPGLRLIMAVSVEAAALATEATGGSWSDSFESGWSPTSIRVGRTARGARLVHLPHLSRFKLLSRPACEAPLARAFGEAWGPSGARAA